MKRWGVGAAVAAAAAATALAPTGSAAGSALTLGPVTRITTPGTALCPAEGEPEVTWTRLGTWVAYNDDHQCPLNPQMTRVEEVQLVTGQGQIKFIPLDPPAGQVVSGDPDLSPAPDGGVYLSALWSGAPHEGSLSVRILHITSQLKVHALPTPSFHRDKNFDDKEFIAVDTDAASPYAGRLYVVWDDFSGAGTTVLRAWNGHRWLKPVQLQNSASAPDVAVGPGGVVAVAMDDGTKQQVVVRLSHDGGRSFGPPITVLRGSDPGQIDPACPLRPTVGVRQRAMVGQRVAYDTAGNLHVVATLGPSVVDATTASELVLGNAVVRHAVLHGHRVLHSEAVTDPGDEEAWAPALAALPNGGVAVSWLQTNAPKHATYDAWVAAEPAGAKAFSSPQRLSSDSSTFPAVTEAVGNSDCYGIGDYIGMVSTPNGVATVWPTTVGAEPGIDSDVLLRPAHLAH